MHRLAALSLVVLSLSSIARAQSTIADPIDNATSWTSNGIPLSPSPTYDESRAHYYFPAAYLPGTGGTIIAIEFAMTAAVTTPYQLLEFSLDHTQNPNLSTTFASNLTNPQVVYSISNQSLTYAEGWYQFALQTPFAYDGTSNLILESRKVIDWPAAPYRGSGTRVLVWPRRTDTVPPVWASGAFGSGASSAAVANETYSTEVLIRLVFASAPTLKVNSTRNVTGNANRGYYHIGATVTLQNQGAPNAPYGTFFESSIFPAGVPLPGFGGKLWLSSLNFLLDSGSLDASGNSSFSAAIPSDPTLVGLAAHFQSLIVSSTFDFTNVVKAPVAAF